MPLSGFSCPVIILNSVVLPAPFGPITPTIPPGGSLNDSPSISSWSPNAFCSPSTSTTMPPSFGPAAICIEALPTSSRADCSTSLSNAEIRALDLACRAFGLDRIHSSSREIAFCRFSSWPFSTSSRLAFCSSQLE